MILMDGEKMRKLYKGEEPVLPVGYQNLITGENKHWNIFEIYDQNKIESVSLIRAINKDKDGSASSYRLILSGRASQEAILAHDQTHAYIANYKLVKEFTGTYREIFIEIRALTGKNSLPAYVYK